MRTYKRAYEDGGCYFFTVVTHGRKHLLTNKDAVERLRLALKQVMLKRPFKIDAIAVMPDHLHCIWTLPGKDHDFSTRWMIIKRFFSVGIAAECNAQREKAVWQPRFWEHLIRDDEDWRRHMDYIHYNPVKHGYVQRPIEWEHSSFKKAVEQGLYENNWGAAVPQSIRDMDFE